MHLKARLRKSTLLLTVVVLGTLTYWLASVPVDAPPPGVQRPESFSRILDGDVCSLSANDSVHSATGNYGACVSQWLFTFDARTKARLYPDPRPITEEYKTSGVVPQCYTPPPMANASGSGRCFRISEGSLKRLGLPITDFHVVRDDNVDDFVFVTGVSDSHYVESLDAIASVQNFMPTHRIVVYDLGLTKTQLEKMRSYCNVSVAQIDLGDRAIYPHHVQNFATYAFKPLLIMEALKVFPAIVWIDSSVRLHQSLDVFYERVVASGGIFLFIPPPKRSVVHHTHGAVYRYFPTNLRQLRHTLILMPVGYYSRSEGLYWHVLWWWTLCALTKDCTFPCKQNPCSSFTSDNVLAYLGCHRYDMAVLNILLASYHGYDYRLYGGKREIDLFEIQRKETRFYDVKTCPAQKEVNTDE